MSDKKEIRELLIRKYTQKFYLGDGLDIWFDGYHFILETEREHVRHWVGLEPEVFHAFVNYRKQCYEDFEKLREEENK